MQRSRYSSEMVLTHPPSCERKQREPEQQVKISPEYCTCHNGARMQHVMVELRVTLESDEPQQNSNESPDQQREHDAEELITRRFR